MENTMHSPAARPSVIKVGSTEIGIYYWVGLCDNGVDYYAGQTFKAPADGVLSRIKLFPSMVYGDTHATLKLFEFDEQAQTWREQRGHTECSVTKAMEGQWVNFELNGLTVNKNKHYAFKLSCNNGGMLAIAESPWRKDSVAEGTQWIGSSQKKEGVFHRDFSLAFQAEILA